MTILGAVQIVGAQFYSTRHATAADAVAGREGEPTTPAFALLTGRARRFTSLVTQMHLEVCGRLLSSDGTAPRAVFATRHGEIKTAETLIADLRDNAMVSSARFALSVHNTASGLYSVATASHAPTTTVTGSNAIAGGWMEAALTVLAGEPRVLLAIADEPVPAAFQGPSEQVGVAAAFLLAPVGTAGRAAHLVMVPADDAVEVDTVRTLARAAVASVSSDGGIIDLGLISPGARLELRFSGHGEHP